MSSWLGYHSLVRDNGLYHVKVMFTLRWGSLFIAESTVVKRMD
jgi:hypothetical protein